MRITKYMHSCIIAEEKGVTALIDPGSYSHEGKALDIESLERLDYLLITHEHQDHMDVGWVKEIAAKFPKAKVASNASVKNILGREGIEVATEGDSNVAMLPVKHERIIGKPAPENVMFTLFGKLTHPGDSHSFSSTSEILALPVQAPWGSFVAAIELAAKLRPKKVIPIHDWHWNAKAREWFYATAKDYLGKHGIEFIGLETGREVEI